MARTLGVLMVALGFFGCILVAGCGSLQVCLGTCDVRSTEVKS